MLSVKQLIEENNRKRQKLAPENKKFYNDLLDYLRLQTVLSEQQTEEVLMELLDHLLEGQKENKTAAQMFGGDPKAFADEIIRQLPKENKRNMVSFTIRIMILLLGIDLVINGITAFVVERFFSRPLPPFYPVPAALNFFIAGLYVIFAIWYIFRILRKSLFKEKTKKVKILTFLKIYAVIFVFLGGVILLDKFMPKIGPSFSYPWWLPLVLGVVSLGVYYSWEKAAKSRGI